MPDLAVCDVNLDRADQWNTAGVDVATELRENDETLPIAGYSSVLVEEDWPDKQLFSFVLKVAAPKEERVEQIKRWFESAEGHRKTRLQRSQDKVRRYRNEGRSTGRSSPALLSHFTDPALEKLGFALKIIEPGTKQPSLTDGQRTIAHPIPVWTQRSEDVVVAELYRFPLLFGVGDSEEAAVQDLFLLLDGFLDDLRTKGGDGQPDSQLTREIAEYLGRVLGPKA